MRPAKRAYCPLAWWPCFRPTSHACHLGNAGKAPLGARFPPDMRGLCLEKRVTRQNRRHAPPEVVWRAAISVKTHAVRNHNRAGCLKVRPSSRHHNKSLGLSSCSGFRVGSGCCCAGISVVVTACLASYCLPTARRGSNLIAIPAHRAVCRQGNSLQGVRFWFKYVTISLFGVDLLANAVAAALGRRHITR